MRAANNIQVPPLPRGTTLEKIYADFFGYLYQHTQTFFQGRVVDGSSIWQRLRGTAEFIIACPNGWGTREHAFLRKAAIVSGMVPALYAPQRVHIVSEAEASVQFVIERGNTATSFMVSSLSMVVDAFACSNLTSTLLQQGVNFIVCDAGGSTVDTTLYNVCFWIIQIHGLAYPVTCIKVSGTQPLLKLEEKRASACMCRRMRTWQADQSAISYSGVQAGAIFVDQVANAHFIRQLSSVGLDKEDVKVYAQQAVNSFEAEAKKTFQGSHQDDVTVEVGDHRFNQAAIGIRRGRMTVSRLDLPDPRSFFLRR
jgi:hypothetical protein